MGRADDVRALTRHLECVEGTLQCTPRGIRETAKQAPEETDDDDNERSLSEAGRRKKWKEEEATSGNACCH